MGPQCKHHPRAPAGWRCETCRAHLCPDCVYTTRYGTTDVEMTGCCRCGGRVELLVVHRKRQTFPSRIPGTFVYPFHLSTFATTLGCGVVTWLFMKAGCIGNLIGLGVFWGVIFTVIRQSADGRQEIELDFSDPLGDVGYPAIAGLVGTAFIWVPPLIYGYNHGTAGLKSDPVWWALIALGMFYAPMAIVVAATKSPFFRMLNPFAVLGYALKLGGDYAIAVVMLLLLAGLEVLVGTLGSLAFGALKIPIVSSCLGWTVWMFVPVIGAHLLGVLLHTKGDAIGYGDVRDFEEPLLEGAVPRGQAPLSAPPPESPRSHAPIDLEAPAPEAKPRSHAPIELDGLDGLGVPPPPPAPAKPAAPALTPAQQIERAIAANQLDEAMKLYEQQPQPPELSPQQHLAIGQAAVARNQHPLAVKALRAAAKNPAAAETPRAMVLLGRVYGEKLGDLDTANKIFAFVAQKFPGTSAAQFALGRLPPKGD